LSTYCTFDEEIATNMFHFLTGILHLEPAKALLRCWYTNCPLLLANETRGSEKTINLLFTNCRKWDI